MASFTFEVGPLSATRTFANNTKASAVLTAFADKHGLGMSEGEPLSAQQRLQAVLDFVLLEILHDAWGYKEVEAVQAATVQIQSDYNLE